jgi:hypothetical protein
VRTALWLLLKRVPPIAWVEVGVVAFLFGCIGALYIHGEHVGRDRERQTVLVEKLRHDTIEVVLRDSVVRRDTVHLTRTLAHYDTIRETLTITDTIAVRRFVLAADSTVKACRQTVTDLTLSCAAKDKVIHDLRGLLALRVSPDGTHATWKEKLAWAAVGAGAGELVHRLR